LMQKVMFILVLHYIAHWSGDSLKISCNNPHAPSRKPIRRPLRSPGLTPPTFGQVTPISPLPSALPHSSINHAAHSSSRRLISSHNASRDHPQFCDGILWLKISLKMVDYTRKILSLQSQLHVASTPSSYKDHAHPTTNSVCAS